MQGRVGFVNAAPNFVQTTDIKELIAAANAAGPLTAIFIDTYDREPSGTPEDTDKSAWEVLARCEELGRAAGALVVLVRRVAHDILLLYADRAIRVSCDEQRVAKVRSGDEFKFKLKQVPIGVDADGRKVTSCVVEHDDVNVLTA